MSKLTDKLKVMQANGIYFDFSKYDNVSKKSTFLYFAILYTLPSEIHYTYPSRNKFLQTMGGGFLDKFPMGLPKIRISGTFGKERRGFLYQDGLTRLQIFKKIIKNYHKVQDESNVEAVLDRIGEHGYLATLEKWWRWLSIHEREKVGQLYGRIGDQYFYESFYETKTHILLARKLLEKIRNKCMLRTNEAYTLTLYDFINGEIWLVDPTAFDITESAKTQANLPRYDLRMQAVGKPLGGKFDEILQKVMAAKDIVLLAANLAGSIDWQKERAAKLWTSLLKCFK